MKKLLYILLFTVFIAGSNAAPRAPFNKGVNFSNWFQESSVNLVGFTTYTKQDFLNVKGMGGDAIRLPVNFYAMTSGSPDYTVSPLLFTMLDTVVAWAEEEEMYLILDNHSYDPSFNAHPDLKNILSKMWFQIADHYKGGSHFVLYEIINEPAGFTDAVWADMMQTVVAKIRTVDTVHTIVISPLEWSSYGKLNSLPIFADKKLLYTIHYYGPFLFTHQGASWVGLDSLNQLPFPYGASPMPAVPSKYKGTWIETDMNNYNTGGTIKRVKEQIGIAAKFAATRNVPLWCGEFGVYIPNVIPEQRVFWYDTVSKILESQGIAWTIWDYHNAFGIFNTPTWGSFEHDVNVPLVEALGFTAPAQTPYIKRTEMSELVIYDDYLSPGIHNVSLTKGQVDMYSEKQPATGRYSVSLNKFKMPDAMSFVFLKDKDMSQLRAEGYALEFKLRTGYVGKFAVRFLDTKTSAADKPWRAQATVSVNAVHPTQDWQTISIPLTNFADIGAWDAKWYNSEGKFDWKAIDRFEISAAFADFGDSVLYFDQIRIRIPGSPEPVVVKPVVPVAPDAGVIEPIVPEPIILPEPVATPPVEVAVVPEPVIVPPTEVVVPEPVVTPPDEVVLLPEPDTTLPEEVVVIPEPAATPPDEVTVVPEPAIVPPTEVVVPEPVVTPPDEAVLLPEPDTTLPEEVVVIPEPAVTPPDEVTVVPEPAIVPPTEVVVPEPVVTPPDEVVLLPEPVTTLPEEVVVIPEPAATPPDEVTVVPGPAIVSPTEVVVPEPVVTPPDKVVLLPEPAVTQPDEVAVVPEPATNTDIPASEIVEHDSIVKLRPDQILVAKPIIDLPEEQTIATEPVVVPKDQPELVAEPVTETEPDVVLPVKETIIPEPIEMPSNGEVADTVEYESNVLILTPKKIAEVPVEVVITLQPSPDVPDIEIDTVSKIVEDAGQMNESELITEGTGDFAPVIDSLVSEEIAQDTTRVDVAVADSSDSNLADSLQGEGTGSIKQMVTTSQSENKTEPYYFRLDNGWLIIVSEKTVVSITILDASLRLVMKAEDTNKILVEYLPQGNYFVIVKFADGFEFMKPAIF